MRGTLEPAVELEDHARVELDGDDGLGNLEELLGEIPGTRADLKDDVGGFDAGLLDDGLDQHGVLQDMLALRFLEGDAAAPPLLLRRLLMPLLLDLAARHGRASSLPGSSAVIWSSARVRVFSSALNEMGLFRVPNS